MCRTCDAEVILFDNWHRAVHFVCGRAVTDGFRASQWVSVSHRCSGNVFLPSRLTALAGFTELQLVGSALPDLPPWLAQMPELRHGNLSHFARSPQE